MTEHQMVEAWVKRGIKAIISKDDKLIDIDYYKPDTRQWSEKKSIVIRVKRKNCVMARPIYRTVSDLLFDPDFMRAVYGDKLVCEACGAEYKDLPYCNCDYHVWISNYCYMSIEAVKHAMLEIPYVEYLYDNMPEVGEDD